MRLRQPWRGETLGLEDARWPTALRLVEYSQEASPARHITSPAILANLWCLGRAWYNAPLEIFRDSPTTAIVGELTINCPLTVTPEQIRAWEQEIEVLRRASGALAGAIYLEFAIPRFGRRADAILLIGPAVFVIEFKAGSSEFAAAGREQVWDYALDLKNFHRSSHQAPIIPILVATEAASTRLAPLVPDDDQVFRPIDSSAAQLSEVFAQALASLPPLPFLDAATWADSSYWPTPTIIEAARALYSRHSVEAIARSDAGAKNLHRTAARLRELAACARREGKKAMGFVTGVPGAGKTLVGLDLATRRGDDAEKSDSSHAVYLSGNGPLVAVLREALARDELQRL